jgi:diguanylate cyclase (GGDEF)-like protein
MISLKKYLDAPSSAGSSAACPEDHDVLAATMAAYSSALLEMGDSGAEACPGLGDGLKRSLGRLQEKLSVDMTRDQVDAAERSVREQLQKWGIGAARQNQERTSEVKELLIVMAHTAESVGERDQRCAGQMNAVTARLKKIASLDNLTEVRVSIEESAAQLKTQIDRMTSEGKAAIDKLRAEVTEYQAKLEEAERAASLDGLTGLRSRVWMESQIERRMAAGSPLCVAMIDIDDFKKVNDSHGHLTGDELLKQFAGEIKSACRSTDAIGRWGGDEFMILFDCGLPKASAQVDRTKEWVCGNYSVEGRAGQIKLRVNASMGVAEFRAPETMKNLLSRADAAMYQNKSSSRADGTSMNA